MNKKILISSCILTLLTNCAFKVNASIEYEIMCRNYIYAEPAPSPEITIFLLETENFVTTMAVLYWYREQIHSQKTGEIIDAESFDIRFQYILKKIDNALNYYWELREIARKVNEPYHDWRSFCGFPSKKLNANEQFAHSILASSLGHCERRYSDNKPKVCGDEILPLEWNWAKDTTLDKIILHNIRRQLNTINAYKKKCESILNREKTF